MAATSAATAAVSDRPIAFGDPVPGLTAQQNDAFVDGKNDFAEVESVADGLGPVFKAAPAPSATASRPSAAAASVP